MEWIADPTAWVGLLTLVALEIVLGVDNLIFIAILSDKLPVQQRERARVIGLSLALFMRLALLIGQSADPATVASLRRFVETCEGVDQVYRVLTLQLGTSLMVSLKVKIKARSAAELVSRINEIEAALRIEFPEIQWLFFEPDVAD